MLKDAILFFAAKWAKKNRIKVSLGNARLISYNAIRIKDLMLSIESPFPTRVILTVEIGWKYLDLLRKKYSPKYCIISVAQINIDYSDFIQNKRDTGSSVNNSTVSGTLWRDVLPFVNRLASNLFQRFPDKLKGFNIKVEVKKDNNVFIIKTLSAHYNNNLYEICFDYFDLGEMHNVLIKGRLDKTAKTISLESLTSSSPLIRFPFLSTIYGIAIEIGHWDLILRFDFSNREDIAFYINHSARNLSLKWGEVAPIPIILELFSFELNGNLSKEGITTETPSAGIFNFIPFFLYVFYPTAKDSLVKLVITFEDIEPDHLLRSFPHFSMQGIKSIQCTGTFSFQLSLAYLCSNPLSHIFSTEFLHEDLSIKDTGDLQLGYLNQSFLHKTSKIGNNVIRDIIVGPDNSHFAPIDKIAPLLIETILCTEDPNYFSHAGIDEKFLGLALVSNIKDRKYTKGGSTITMQLSRNLFLHHEKTIYRKLEEIILSWLLENIFKISKKRLLEIYLNIIEWGEQIYGIGEASEFYFSKDPKYLDLSECLVLSYIIPRPKHFLNALRSGSEVLKSNLATHIKEFSSILLIKGVITFEQFKDIKEIILFSNSLGSIKL